MMKGYMVCVTALLIIGLIESAKMYIRDKEKTVSRINGDIHLGYTFVYTVTLHHFIDSLVLFVPVYFYMNRERNKLGTVFIRTILLLMISIYFIGSAVLRSNYIWHNISEAGGNIPDSKIKFITREVAAVAGINLMNTILIVMFMDCYRSFTCEMDIRIENKNK